MWGLLKFGWMPSFSFAMLGASVPESGMYGAPSEAASVTRERSSVYGETFFTSIHSSSANAFVPIQAISLMMRGRRETNASCAVEVAARPAMS